MINRDARLVTVFGGGGFIGRYVCERLFDADVRVRVASRNPVRAHIIQPLATVGQWGIVRADIRRAGDVRKAIRGASAVINLCGSFKQMGAVHVEGARNVAEAARDAGAEALVHVSAIGADPESPSEYGRTKGEGEQAAREAFPQATIIRPSLVFGPEDDFTNRIAAMGRLLPLLPVVAPGCRFQPVYVEDVARAIAAAAVDPARYGGRTYDIAGPQVLTMREFVGEILKAARRDPELVELPAFVSALISNLGFLPGAPLTRDQWLMLQRDNVAAEGSAGLEAFGIKPTPFAAIAPEWLVLYRRGGRFAAHRPRQAL